MGKNTFYNLACFMDRGVSFFAFGVALTLVIYMLSTFVGAGAEFFSRLSTGFDSTNIDRAIVESEILHFVAFTVVLIKAYKILISYAKTHHINIKYMVEIAIIAPTIEIVFNSHAYEVEVLILFAFFGIANLIVYVLFYDKFKEIGKAAHKMA